tara:strand:+ start:6141 stop:6938 length:798 start_codon:yes stop_codon:yes gene_type:complete
MPTISANGINFNYQIDGPEGAPWITFSNSLATNLTMWDEQTALLSNDWRILRYDQRGHGGTDATTPPYTFDLLVQDLVALWDALGVKRSVLCGLSMGGTTGLGVAIDHDDRLAAYIGCDLPHHSPEEFVNAWNQRQAMAKENGMEGMAEPTTTRWFTEEFRTDPANKAAMDKMLGMISSTKLDGFLGCSGALQTIDYHGRLDRIKVPTLFISGAEDSAAGPELMAPLLDMVAGTEMHVVPNAGHIANIENSADFNAALTGFLNSL